MGAAVTIRYRSDMRAVRERIVSPGSRVVRTDCGSIAYARIGAGYPVLVVHGNAGGFDQGLLLARWTLDPALQVIAPSRFGYPGTPMPSRASVAMQADARGDHRLVQAYDENKRQKERDATEDDVHEEG